VVSKATSWKTLAVASAAEAVEPSILLYDTGKRKIVDRMEEEKSCKFRVDPLVEQEVLVIQEKGKQCDKRIGRRPRDKKRMKEVEEFHELREQL